MRFNGAKPHWLLRYGIAVACFGATLGLAYLLRYVDFRINLTIPIVVSLVITAWYGGRGPGILLAVLFQASTILLAPQRPDPSLAKSIFTWGSVFLVLVFITWVVSGLRRALVELRDQRDILRVTLASIGDGVITTDPEGRITFINPAAAKLTSWEPNEANGRPLREVFNIINEATRLPVADPVAKVLSTGSTIGLANHTVLIARDGREVPIDDCAAPILDDGKIKGVVLVFSDVSEKKRAERMAREKAMMQTVIAVQEAERHRIARDIHDHLGQKMTALRLRVGSLAAVTNGNGKFREAIDEVQAAASEIDRDIGYLSWELRPTELENLGLADALASFVREWSRQHGINAEFHGPESVSGNGRLPRDVETNLYRITQEALNNVLKHANAEHVNVLLQKRNNDLILIIEDDGRGFNELHSTGDGSRYGGQGLLGIRERAAVLNGTLEIDSREGDGTTIVARVPIS